jgi:hypothetical protein
MEDVTHETKRSDGRYSSAFLRLSFYLCPALVFLSIPADKSVGPVTCLLSLIIGTLYMAAGFHAFEKNLRVQGLIGDEPSPFSSFIDRILSKI